MAVMMTHPETGLQAEMTEQEAAGWELFGWVPVDSGDAPVDLDSAASCEQANGEDS